MSYPFADCTRTDVTPTRDGTYKEVDVSGLAAAGAIAAVIEVWNEGTEDYSFALRKKGSTDDFFYEAHASASVTPTRLICYVGLDGDRKFEAKLQSPSGGDLPDGLKLYMYAYIITGVGTFFDNAVDKTPGSTGRQTVDISGDTGGDTAGAAAFLVVNTDAGGGHHFYLRPYGNSYQSADRLRDVSQKGLFMGCDALERLEWSTDNVADQKLYLLGYITSDYWANTSPTISSILSAVDTWEDWTLSGVPASTPHALIIENPTTWTRFKFGLRENGSSDDNYAHLDPTPL
jgi:hypothetical protein